MKFHLASPVEQPEHSSFISLLAGGLQLGGALVAPTVLFWTLPTAPVALHGASVDTNADIDNVNANYVYDDGNNNNKQPNTGYNHEKQELARREPLWVAKTPAPLGVKGVLPFSVGNAYSSLAPPTRAADFSPTASSPILPTSVLPIGPQLYIKDAQAIAATLFILAFIVYRVVSRIGILSTASDSRAVPAGGEGSGDGGEGEMRSGSGGGGGEGPSGPPQEVRNAEGPGLDASSDIQGVSGRSSGGGGGDGGPPSPSSSGSEPNFGIWRDDGWGTLLIWMLGGCLFQLFWKWLKAQYRRGNGRQTDIDDKNSEPPAWLPPLLSRFTTANVNVDVNAFSILAAASPMAFGVAVGATHLAWGREYGSLLLELAYGPPTTAGNPRPNVSLNGSLAELGSAESSVYSGTNLYMDPSLNESLLDTPTMPEFNLRNLDRTSPAKSDPRPESPWSLSAGEGVDRLVVDGVAKSKSDRVPEGHVTGLYKDFITVVEDPVRKTKTVIDTDRGFAVVAGANAYVGSILPLESDNAPYTLVENIPEPNIACIADLKERNLFIRNFWTALRGWWNGPKALHAGLEGIEYNKVVVGYKPFWYLQHLERLASSYMEAYGSAARWYISLSNWNSSSSSWTDALPLSTYIQYLIIRHCVLAVFNFFSRIGLSLYNQYFFIQLAALGITAVASPMVDAFFYLVQIGEFVFSIVSAGVDVCITLYHTIRDATEPWTTEALYYAGPFYEQLKKFELFVDIRLLPWLVAGLLGLVALVATDSEGDSAHIIPPLQFTAETVPLPEVVEEVQSLESESMDQNDPNIRSFKGNSSAVFPKVLSDPWFMLWLGFGNTFALLWRIGTNGAREDESAPSATRPIDSPITHPVRTQDDTPLRDLPPQSETTSENPDEEDEQIEPSPAPSSPRTLVRFAGNPTIIPSSSRALVPYPGNWSTTYNLNDIERMTVIPAFLNTFADRMSTRLREVNESFGSTIIAVESKLEEGLGHAHASTSKLEEGFAQAQASILKLAEGLVQTQTSTEKIQQFTEKNIEQLGLGLAEVRDQLVRMKAKRGQDSRSDTEIFVDNVNNYAKLEETLNKLDETVDSLQTQRDADHEKQQHLGDTFAKLDQDFSALKQESGTGVAHCINHLSEHKQGIDALGRAIVADSEKIAALEDVVTRLGRVHRDSVQELERLLQAEKKQRMEDAERMRRLEERLNELEARALQDAKRIQTVEEALQISTAAGEQGISLRLAKADSDIEEIDCNTFSNTLVVHQMEPVVTRLEPMVEFLEGFVALVNEECQDIPVPERVEEIPLTDSTRRWLKELMRSPAPHNASFTFGSGKSELMAVSGDLDGVSSGFGTPAGLSGDPFMSRPNPSAPSMVAGPSSMPSAAHPHLTTTMSTMSLSEFVADLRADLEPSPSSLAGVGAEPPLPAPFGLSESQWNKLDAELGFYSEAWNRPSLIPEPQSLEGTSGQGIATESLSHQPASSLTLTDTIRPSGQSKRVRFHPDPTDENDAPEGEDASEEVAEESMRSPTPLPRGSVQDKPGTPTRDTPPSSPPTFTPSHPGPMGVIRMPLASLNAARIERRRLGRPY